MYISYKSLRVKMKHVQVVHDMDSTIMSLADELLITVKLLTSFCAQKLELLRYDKFVQEFSK